MAAVLLLGCLQSGPETPLFIHDAFVNPARTSLLVIELDHSPSVAPSEDALSGMLIEIEDLTTIGVELRRVDQVGTRPAGGSWTREEIVELAEDTRDLPGSDADAREAYLHIVVLAGRGPLVDGGRVAGLAIGSTAFMFPEEALPPPIPTSMENPLGSTIKHPRLPEVERAVLTHEVGHILGLVDHGISMVKPHKDPSGTAHSDNPASVMFGEVDTTFDYLVPGEDRPIPFRFDENDIADIRAYQALRQNDRIG